MLQAFRVGPIGSGLIVVTYPSSIAIPFCIIALEERRPVHPGGAGNRLGSVSGSNFDALVSVEASCYANCQRHRTNSADYYRLGRRIRRHRGRAGRRIRSGRPGVSRGHFCSHRRASAAGEGTVAGLGATYRHRGRLDCGRGFRNIRLRPSQGGPARWTALERLAWLGIRFRPHLLVASSRLSVRFRDIGYCRPTP